jgi:hypothetical protein
MPKLMNYTHYDVPAGPLKNKRIVVPPGIGTADYPDPVDARGRKIAKQNRRTLWRLWDEDKRGPLYLSSQLSRTKQWAKVARKYEAAPQDFARAWRYLNEHPIFYKFRDFDEDMPLTQILQERNLEHTYGFSRIDFQVARWCKFGRNCDMREEVRDCEHPRITVAWMEAGEWSWPADKDPAHPYEPRPGRHAFHDYRLDVYGDTYESCVLQLAYRVWKLYGNDRRACQENRVVKPQGDASDA